MKKLLSFLSILSAAFTSNAQCAAGEVEVTFDITTDQWGYEAYWELVPTGNGCGNGTIFAGGNTSVGCNGGGNQTASAGSGYASSANFTEGPFCLTEGSSYDIIFIDDWGDGGTSFGINVGGYPIDDYSGAGSNDTYSFTADLPPTLEISIESISTPAYVDAGTNDIEGHIMNNGQNTITSFDLHYSINNGSTLTQNLTGLNVTSFSEYEFNHNIQWNESVTGAYLLKVWVDNINGQSDFDDTDNELQKTINIKEPIPNIIPSYTASGATYTYEVIANSSDQIVEPTDLDFHPNGDLWVINFGTENSGGSTVKITDPNSGSPTTLWQQDGNAWHFMSLPSGIAFSNNGNFATSTAVFDANHQSTTSPFTGPTLWSSDPAIYAQPSGGNGSHIDMLHESPYCMGIAAYDDNAFWVFDKNSNDIVMYDFQEDHGPGNDDHSDAIVLRYPEVQVDWINQNIPSHLKYQKESDNLFIMDGGNGRIVMMEANSGTVGGTPAFGPFEPLAQYENVTGVTQVDLINTGFTQGCGIDVIDHNIIISDFSNGDIIIFERNGNTATETGRISTGSAGVAGVVIGPEGRIWYVNNTTNEVIKIEPNNIIISGEETVIKSEFAFTLSPNPTRDFIKINTIETVNSVQVEILDLNGKYVYSNNNFDVSDRIDITKLSSGIYSVRVRNDNQQLIKKLVVQ